MDSGNESEPSRIKLRKYAKKARIGTLKQLDGTIQDVPGWDEEPKLFHEVVDQLNQNERRLGERSPFLRWVFILNRTT